VRVTRMVMRIAKGVPASREVGREPGDDQVILARVETRDTCRYLDLEQCAVAFKPTAVL
jgi:hypothetical protein